jgi:excisionase family DNA binding protein
MASDNAQRAALQRLQHAGDEQLLTPTDVAAVFRVDPKTVTRWGAAGKLPCIKTPGGHRRFRVADIRAALQEDGSGTTGSTATGSTPTTPTTPRS